MSPKPTLRQFRKQRFVSIFLPEAYFIAAFAAAALLAWLAGCTRTSFFLAASSAALCGLIPPRWLGWRERSKRALCAKWKESRKWGFHSRDRDFPWVAHIEGPLIVRAPCAKGEYFYSEWLIIHDGHIIVNPGRSEVDPVTHAVTYDHSVRRTYAWDGCTPKASWLWCALIGTPDWWQKKFSIVTVSEQGLASKETVFWPMTHYASVVHDALYQYLHQLPIARCEVDRLFHSMLVEAGMRPSLAMFYYRMVRRFGGSGVKEGNHVELSVPPVTSALLDQLGDAVRPGLTSPAKSPLS